MSESSATKFERLKADTQSLLKESLDELPVQRPKSLPRRLFQFAVLVGRSFLRNRCPVRASALAYTTLLSLIPILAVGVGVSSSLLKQRGEQPIQQFIDTLIARVAPQLDLVTNVPPTPIGDAEAQPAAGDRLPSSELETDEMQGPFLRRTGQQEVVARIYQYIANIDSGAVGTTGVFALIFVSISLLTTIEATFNDIWGVSRGRSWMARVVNYWAVITLGPLALVTAIGLTTSSQFEATQRFLGGAHFVGRLMLTMMQFAVPFIVLSLAFTLFYLLMPNTRVTWKAAMVGGLVGGFLWQLNNYFNVIYVSRVVTYSNIYGSLGIVPVFLIGLYFSWLILLLGAQVGYAYQNRHAYWQERLAGGINQSGREFAALRLMTFMGVRFDAGGGSVALTEMSEKLGIPSRLASQVLQQLIQAHLVVEVSSTELAYAPARPLDRVSLRDVLEPLRAGQGQDIATREDPARIVVRSEFDRIVQTGWQAAETVSLASLVRVAKLADAGERQGITSAAPSTGKTDS